MKKLLLILGIAVFVTLFAVNGTSLLGLFSSGEYSAYGLETVFRAENVRYRDYKTFVEATAPTKLGALAALSCNKRQGESVTLEGGEAELKALLSRLKVEVLTRQTVAGTQIVYGYTARLAGGILLDGALVNIEIACRADKIVVGTPIILGAY